MKKRKSFIKKIVVIILGIILFTTGYLISSTLLVKNISSSDFKFYEQVAKDVYEQGDKTIYEVPDGISLQRTNTSITISSANNNYFGKVVAKLQNGKLVFTHDLETRETIVLNSFFGFICVIIPALLYLGCKRNNG